MLINIFIGFGTASSIIDLIVINYMLVVDDHLLIDFEVDLSNVIDYR